MVSEPLQSRAIYPPFIQILRITLIMDAAKIEKRIQLMR